MPYGGGFGGYQAAGGIGSFLKGAAKAAIGFVTGGPIGAIQAVTSHPSSAAPAAQLPAMPSTPIPSSMISPTPGIAGVVQRTLPGGASGYQLQGVPRGYHVSRSSGRVVKNRRRNFANGKALNRAVSRVAGFERMVKRTRKSLRSLAKV
jgi:hypothetical protein